MPKYFINETGRIVTMHQLNDGSLICVVSKGD